MAASPHDFPVCPSSSTCSSRSDLLSAAAVPLQQKPQTVQMNSDAGASGSSTVDRQTTSVELHLDTEMPVRDVSLTDVSGSGHSAQELSASWKDSPFCGEGCVDDFDFLNQTCIVAEGDQASSSEGVHALSGMGTDNNHTGPKLSQREKHRRDKGFNRHRGGKHLDYYSYWFRKRSKTRRQ